MDRTKNKTKSFRTMSFVVCSVVSENELGENSYFVGISDDDLEEFDEHIRIYFGINWNKYFSVSPSSIKIYPTRML